MTTTEDSTRDQKMCEHLRTLEESGPMPTFDSIRPIANALYDFHESVADRAGALGWLSEFGDDPQHYTELSLEFIDQARDLRLVLANALTSSLCGERLDQGRRLAVELASLLVPDVDALAWAVRPELFERGGGGWTESSGPASFRGVRALRRFRP